MLPEAVVIDALTTRLPLKEGDPDFDISLFLLPLSVSVRNTHIPRFLYRLAIYQRAGTRRNF